ncbi:MAG: PQQ-binding-like beta-propeller repeat protein [Deltaproteobacteria bacterium]|nr:PQQ-binding-like beta-propeller repeat protein [Deltaproteobacteria bacterium]
MVKSRTLIFIFIFLLFAPFADAVKIIKKGSGPVYKIPFRPKWVSMIKKGKLFKYQRKEFASPRVYRDLIFVGADSHYFYCLKSKNGHKLWRFEAKGAVHSVPSFSEETVFFGDNKGIFYALDIKTGNERWRFNDAGSEILAPAAIHENTIYLTTLEGKLIALDLHSGQKNWELTHALQSKKGFTIRNHSGPVLFQGAVIVGFADGVLAAYSEKEGNPLWEKDLAAGEGSFRDVDMTPLIEENRLYAAGFQGDLFCLELTPKKSSNSTVPKVLWQQKIGSDVGFAIQDDVLYVSGSDGILYALNKMSGVKVWEKKIGRGGLSAPAVLKSTVVVATTDKEVFFVNTLNGDIKIGRFAKKGVFGDPTIDGDRVYYLSNGGRLYSLKIVY